MPSDKSGWAATGIDDALRDALNEGLPASELWSLLLGVMEKRARRRNPAALMKQWRNDRFVQPCAIEQRVLHEIDTHLLATASQFEAVELAPLAPLGVCASVAVTSQNRIVSTARGTEVVADPTNVLALECAYRLRDRPRAEVKLASSHRCTRAQAVPSRPGHAAHFRIFCLASAAHERKDQTFVTGAIAEHIQTHLRALDRLEQHGYSFPGRRIELSSTSRCRHLADRIAAAFPDIPITQAELTHSYYDGLRFMIDITVPGGTTLPLVDGGSFDWLRKFSANDKLAFVASGMGSQLVASSLGR